MLVKEEGQWHEARSVINIQAVQSRARCDTLSRWHSYRAACATCKQIHYLADYCPIHSKPPAPPLPKLKLGKQVVLRLTLTRCATTAKGFCCPRCPPLHTVCSSPSRLRQREAQGSADAGFHGNPSELNSPICHGCQPANGAGCCDMSLPLTVSHPSLHFAISLKCQRGCWAHEGQTGLSALTHAHTHTAGCTKQVVDTFGSICTKLASEWVIWRVNKHQHITSCVNRKTRSDESWGQRLVWASHIPEGRLSPSSHWPSQLENLFFSFAYPCCPCACVFALHATCF